MEERRLEEARSLRRFFHEQWSQFNHLLDQRERVRQRQRESRDQLDLAVSSLFGQDTSQRLIRRRYRERLRKGAGGVLLYIDQLVNELPPPRQLPPGLLSSHRPELDRLPGDIQPAGAKQCYFVSCGTELFMPEFSEQALRAGFKRFLFDDLVAQLRLRFRELQREPWAGGPESYLERLLEILSLPLDLLHSEGGRVRIVSPGAHQQERLLEMVTLQPAESVRATDEKPEQCHQL